MKKYIFTTLVLIAIGNPAYSMKKYITRIYKNDYRTLQINGNCDWSIPPVIRLNDNQNICLSFDQMSHDINYLSFKIIHCNSDWTESNLSESEYLSGFNNNPVENNTLSFNTFSNYTHYKLNIPNDKVNFKISGNYSIIVYNDNYPDTPVLTACFSISEDVVKIIPDITSNTDIDLNKNHQQVQFTILKQSFNLNNPQLDLKIIVQQNGRTDNQVIVTNPTYIGNNKLVYEHNRNLIFPAGNEYRRFEDVNVKYAGLNVERIAFKEPYYYVTLFPDEIRSNRIYLYDQDQFGSYVIRQSYASDNDTEADYLPVHFTLNYDNPFIEGSIYLNGALTYGLFDDTYKMKYNFDNKSYECTLLLKQGSYNYQYLFLPNNSTIAETKLIEGDYFETENQYRIYVYYRSQGDRYDRLIGFKTVLSSNNPKLQ